ncbi:RNA-directed DNA polymerase [Anabaena sp. PCC 7108]|uniref:RNA-directed DNA polymerase n=1 Tax=Anabaena sp. PCC 7108 TaxID=163908 RepID=UPI0003498B7D|nr:RNA-directed DNA polymerase [Anabaena sp. PCC 7108]
MKRHGNLWEDITGFSNLLAAAKQAQKGKRFRDNVLEFNYNLERELFNLQAELISKTYLPGNYKTFYIFESKPRLISAAPYRDRVVHHALCHVVAPIFERTFIDTSYANRIGFGSHRALKKFTEFARSSQYVLLADICKYFPSIDHEILKSIIRQKIKCSDTLWLIDNIIDHSNPQEPVNFHFIGDDLLSPLYRKRGLPIGNLTSQFMANVYLNYFDHFIKETLKINKYIRYVDDFALFADKKDSLEKARLQIEAYLATLRLKIHPVKSQIFRTKYGANFVGFRVLPDRIRVRSDSLRQGMKKRKMMLTDYNQDKINDETLSQSIQSWFAHLKHGDTWRLRENLINSLAIFGEFMI